MMPTISVKIYYKGTELPCPVSNIHEWIDLKRRIVETEFEKTPDEMIEILNHLEQKITDEQLRKNKVGTVLSIEKFTSRCFGADKKKKIGTWISYVVKLVSIGKLIQSDDNGWVAFTANQSTGEFIQDKEGTEEETILPLHLKGGDWINPEEYICSIEKQRQKHCKVCEEPSSKKCPNCPVYYCCREHQVADWKEGHKIVCEQNLASFEETKKKVLSFR